MPHIFECPLYIWMSLVYFNAPICLDTTHIFGYHLYVSMSPICLDIPTCLDAPCMLECPHMFGCPPVCLDVPICSSIYVWMPLYVWTSPVCLDAPLYVLMIFGCLLYTHNTKKACFVRLRGCPYAPIHLDVPICLDAPCMFRWPPYVWTPPICLDAPMYVWMMFGCLVYIYNTKKACFVRLRWCPYAVYTFGSPLCLDTPIYSDTTHMFGCHSYLWMPTYFLGASKHARGSQIYGEHPTIQSGVQT